MSPFSGRVWFNGKPKATVFSKSSRLRLAVKRFLEAEALSEHPEPTALAAGEPTALAAGAAAEIPEAARPEASAYGSKGCNRWVSSSPAAEVLFCRAIDSAAR